MNAGPIPDGLHLETLAVSHGYDPASALGAAKPPLYLASTFTYPSAQAAKDAHHAFFDGQAPERGAGYIYSRLDHPNLTMLQARLAALDGAEDAAAFNSGMAAISAVILHAVEPGRSVLYSRPIYGGTQSLLHGLFARLGVGAFGWKDGLDAASLDAAAAAARPHGPVALIMVETPANPTAGLTDLALVRRLADRLASEQGSRPLVAVDNTFLGPLLQKPLGHGADLCITSLTKYAGGHSDLLGGCVTGALDVVGPLRRLRTGLGTHLDPFTCWLVLRSLETLPLRSARANSNAAAVAGFLASHPKVAAVTWLGLLEPGSPARAAYDRQCLGAGSTFSFRIRGGEREAFALLDALRVIRMAVSLGGTESLICHSATTTHYAVPRATREEVGVDDSSLRISLGIEHPDDLIADLSRGLDAF